MSEPNAGSDLASVGTRATVRCDGGWRLNGRKIWTTNAHHSHYMIALVRTSGDAGRPAEGPVAVHRRPDAARHHRPADPRPGGRRALHRGLLRRRAAARRRAGRRGGQRLGAGERRTRLRAQRPGAHLLQHRAAGALDGLPAQHGAGRRHAETLGRFATHLATLRSMSIAVTTKLVARRKPGGRGGAGQGHRHRRSSRPFPPLIVDGRRGATRRARSMPTCCAPRLPGQVAPTFSLRGGTREILRGMIARGLGLR